MKRLVQNLKRVMDGERGQGMVEYGLIIGLVAVALVVTIGALNGSISSLFTRIKGTLDGAG